MSKSLSKGLEAVPTCDYDQLWGEISDLLGKQLHVLSGAKGDNVKTLRCLLDDRQTLPANRTRSAQNA
jgi:hypothetical protein